MDSIDHEQISQSLLDAANWFLPFLKKGRFTKIEDEQQLSKCLEEIYLFILNCAGSKDRFSQYAFSYFCESDKKECAKIMSWMEDLQRAVRFLNRSDIVFFLDRLQKQSALAVILERLLAYAAGEKDTLAMAENTANDSSNGGNGEGEGKTSNEKTKESAKCHRLRSSESIRFIGDTEQSVVHDKCCELVKAIPDDVMEGFEMYPREYGTCPTCEMRTYIRAGAKDYENVEQYLFLFEHMGIDVTLARHLFAVLGFRTQISTMFTDGYRYSRLRDNAITVWYREDAWRIGLLDHDRVRLEHNNYRWRDDGVRVFTPGFHIQNQNCNCVDVRSVTEVIHRYRAVNHQELKAAAKKGQESRILRRPLGTEESLRLQKSQNLPRDLDLQKEQTILHDGRTSISASRMGDFFHKFSDWLGRVFHRKKVHPTLFEQLKDANENPGPKNGEICLYLWENNLGERKWECGKYDGSGQKFVVNYGKATVRVSIFKVIYWVPIAELKA